MLAANAGLNEVSTILERLFFGSLKVFHLILSFVRINLITNIHIKIQPVKKRHKFT